VASYACLKSPKDSKSKNCENQIETLRLFVNELEFCDDVNCTGLLGLRRLLAARCSDKLCPHPPEYPAAFYWALSLVQNQMSTMIPGMGRSISLLLRSAIISNDVRVVEELVEMCGNINHTHITRWFSPAHYLCFSFRKNGYKVPEVFRLLIQRGLDLHIVADSIFAGGLQYETIQGHTPLMLTMRYSRSFFIFRNLLRDLSIDIPNFIREELQKWPLVEAGWNPQTLQRLFDINFTPFKTLDIMCRYCDDRHEVAPEFSWYKFLDRIKVYGSERIGDIEILHLRDQEMSKEDDSSDVCYQCYTDRVRQTSKSSR
jgi:hypothetical protein